MGSLPQHSWRGWGKVYFIRAETGLVKIGMSADLHRRLDELRGASPCALELLFTIASPDPAALERRYHNRFRSQRILGEWFALSPEDLDAVRREHPDAPADQAEYLAEQHRLYGPVDRLFDQWEREGRLP